jgi:hypothetical protein
MVGIQIEFQGASSYLYQNGYSIKEEDILYERLLQDVIENPLWYLDQLDYLREFRVSWVDYKNQRVTKCYKYVKNKKLYK